ncbi:hormonally up-regulated neu tumor-associated kinase-like [Gigantopelta aegis]|uniref:hormonally up-regulated neu tumor-associated kinase-like n=1 Tax=Gigantopelta aegis TaxID=1735272 RepID=UPI001B888B2C|nr:hormonally up-regulated neu tumor-associated kinase-like [Gigantopelta aegis]
MERKKKVGHYMLGPTIGEGKYSTVRQGTHTLSGEKVAVKIVDKKALVQKEAARRNFRREAILLQKLDHPNIVCLYEALETFNSYYLVVELGDGGSLKQFVASRNLLNEDEAQNYFQQMASALHHLHMLNIVHRDLTLENFLLKKNMDLLLTGFGHGGICEKGSSLDTRCKTTIYSAPEILYGRVYGAAVDVWSLGICLHVMLTGRFPFPSGSVQDIFKLHSTVLKGCRAPKYLSKACQDLLSRLLEPTENKRISIIEIICHKWVTRTSADSVVRPLSKRGKPALNEDVLNVMVAVLSFSETDIIRSMGENKINSATATYKLLSKRNLPLDQFLEHVPGDNKSECCQSKCYSECETKDSNNVDIVSKMPNISISKGKLPNVVSDVQMSLPSTLRPCVFCEHETHVLPVCGLRILSLKDNHFEKNLFYETERYKLPDILKHHHQQQQQHRRQRQKPQHKQQHNHKPLSGQCSVAYAWSTNSEDTEIKLKARATVASISDKYKVRNESSTSDIFPTAPPNTSQGLRSHQSQDTQQQNEICVKSDTSHDMLIENSLYNTEKKTASYSKPVSFTRRQIDDDQTVPSSELLAIRTSSGRSMAILKKMAKHNKQGTLPVPGQFVPECAVVNEVNRISSSPIPCRSHTSMSEDSAASNEDIFLPVIKVTITTCRH